jgi:kumamolisin
MSMSFYDTEPVAALHELKDVVRAVFGVRLAVDSDQRVEISGDVYWPTAGDATSPAQLTALYGFPAEGDQSEQCIGIVELADGYCAADLAQHFEEFDQSAGLKTVAVDHGGYRSTDDPSGPDGEVMLDIDVVSAFAPAIHIVVHFAPDGERGCLVAWRHQPQSLDKPLIAQATA